MRIQNSVFTGALRPALVLVNCLYPITIPGPLQKIPRCPSSMRLIPTLSLVMCNLSNGTGYWNLSLKWLCWSWVMIWAPLLKQNLSSVLKWTKFYDVTVINNIKIYTREGKGLNLKLELSLDYIYIPGLIVSLSLTERYFWFCFCMHCHVVLLIKKKPQMKHMLLYNNILHWYVWLGLMPSL